MRVFYAPPACDFRHTNKPPSVRRRFDKYSELARLRLLLRAGVVSVDDCYKPSLVRPFNVRVILLRRRGVVATIMDRAFGRPASKNSFRRIRPSVLATPTPHPPDLPGPSGNLRERGYTVYNISRARRGARTSVLFIISDGPNALN